MMSKGAVTKLKELAAGRDEDILSRIRLLADTLLALDAVSKKCFSNILAEDWQESISHFEDCFVKLDRAWTPKVHALVFHVPECIRHRERALGPYSEQTGESLHHVWAEYVKERFAHLPKKRFPDPVLHALIRFNAERV